VGQICVLDLSAAFDRAMSHSKFLIRAFSLHRGPKIAGRSITPPVDG